MRATLLAAGLTLPLLGGCAVHQVGDWDRPDVDVPTAYAAAPVDAAPARPALDPWWREFKDAGLDEAMRQAEIGNLELRQAWARIDQALAAARIQGAELFPEVGLEGGAIRQQIRDESGTNAQAGVGTGFGVFGPVQSDPDFSINEVFVSIGLTYEIDLWQRVYSATKSAELQFQASRQDLEETALLLSGLVFEAWYNAKEQLALLALLREQLQISEQLLELTELRFGQGLGTAVDVLQQRQQVAGTRAEIPPAEAALAVSMNQLAVLVGQPPGTLKDLMPDAKVGTLPPLPELGAPANLFTMRPDLKAAMLRVRASDFEVASAVAELLPRLVIDLSYDWRAVDPVTFFNQQIGSIVGNVFQPLFDAGRRLNEVRRRKAIVDEQLAFFGQVYLEALQEVENALSQEKHQIEFIKRLETQEQFSQETLNETRSRYANGLIAYTDVLLAVATLQEVQVRLVGARVDLLLFRSQLYRALGGRWMERLTPPAGKLSATAGGVDSSNKMNLSTK
ncbi:MAG: TolC family protein [Verrucomicrobiota bacterium]